MSWLRSIGGWVVALVATLLAGVGLSAWYRERQRRRGLQDQRRDAAKDKARRAREKQQAELEAALERGEKTAAEADRRAREEVERATSTGDLVDHLTDDIRRGGD